MSGTPIPRELTFAPVEFFCVHAPAAKRYNLVRYDRMQHLMIEYVLKKPKRHEGLIERPVDSDHPIFLLDCTKHEVIPRSMFSSPAPYDFVVTKPSAKIPLVYPLENWAQIEIRFFVSQIQLPLHRQLRAGELSFGLFLFFGFPSH